MYSTTALVKNSRFDGRLAGTHQQLDCAARRLLSPFIPNGQFFPSGRDIIYFEGMRGPDGLKRKSPDNDDPSHMFDGDYGEKLFKQITNHYVNLVRALKTHNDIRAAFEAAWLAHMITDGLTPAHHFPLSEAKDELMPNKKFVKIFGEPIKGIMHGRSLPETMRNNWLYWGAGGHMSKHVAYEYGVAVIVALLPPSSFVPRMNAGDFREHNLDSIFYHAVDKLQLAGVYQRFRRQGWTTEQALFTKNVLLPEIIRTITRAWHSAISEAGHA